MLVINLSVIGNLTRDAPGPPPEPPPAPAPVPAPAPPRVAKRWDEIANLADPRCDPYLVWFDLSYDDGLDADKKRKLPPAAAIEILLELPPKVTQQPKSAIEVLEYLAVAFGFAPRTPPGPHALPQRFVCGTLPVSSVRSLSQAIAERQSWRLDLRFELASARYIADAASFANANVSVQNDAEAFKRLAAMGDKRRGPWPFAQLAAKAWAPLQRQMAPIAQPLAAQKQQPGVGARPPILPKARASAPAGPPAEPLVVVIDDFCNHASHALARRVRSIWFQGRRPRVQPPEGGPPQIGKPAAPAASAGTPPYGVLQDLRPATTAAASRSATASAVVGERHAYPSDGPDRLPPTWSHGSAVLSMLGPKTDHPLPGTSGDGLAALDAPQDIEFVQLPDVAVLDTSGGSLSGFALDAIHHAVARASHLDARPAVIVNLSFGTHSGPHDGTSMFERALLEMLDLYDGRDVDLGDHGKGSLPKLHVVLPAGNTHLERTHASAWLAEQGGSRSLHWMIQPDTETDSFLEIWLDDDAKGQVEIELLPPDGDASATAARTRTLQPGQIHAWQDTTEPQDPVLYAAVIYPRTTSKGQKGRLALVAVAPTQQRASQGRGEVYRGATDEPLVSDAAGGVRDALGRVRMQASPGCWTVRLTNTGTQAVQFHAWIQRHDTAPGRRRASKGYQGRQSYFVEAPGTAVDPRFTLSGIATACKPGQLWVVGAMDERGSIPLYSAAGPDRHFGRRIEGPDVVMTVDRSRNVPGRHVQGVFSGSRLRLGGTSIAAAAFTRLLFDTLARGGTMAWCAPATVAPPQVKTADTPHMADDWMRGSYQRLRHACDVAVPGALCTEGPDRSEGTSSWAR